MAIATNTATRSRFERIPFSPLFQFVLLKPLTYLGKEFAAGDVIDRTDGIDDRKLRQLYEGRFMIPRVDDEGNPVVICTPASLEKPLRKAQLQPAEPEGAAVGDQEDSADAEPPVRVCVHRGFGRYFVMEGEKQISGPHTKAEALKLAPAATE
jgi:hypothetical protein